MTLEQDLLRSGQAIRDDHAAAPVAGSIRRRRRRGQILSAAAAALVVVTGLVTVAPWQTDDPRSLRTVDQNGDDDAVVTAGHGEVTIADAADDELGNLGLEPAMDLDRPRPIADRVRFELLHDPLVADVLAQHGVTGTWEERLRLLDDSGITVHTTIDGATTEAAETAMAAGVEQLADGDTYGGAVAMDTRTGAIRAITGTVNVMTGEPGSLFRPVVMAAALEAGVPSDELLPAPSTFEFGREGSGERFEVHNFGGGDHAPVTVADALVAGLNTPWASLLADGRLVPQAILDLATELGLPMPPSFNAGGGPIGPAVFLGIVDMSAPGFAAVYATLAQGGRWTHPHVIDRITDPSGRDVYRWVAPGRSVIAAAIADQVRDGLRRSVTEGPSTTAALAGGVDQTGYPGTTMRGADAWFAGSTPSLTTVVWLGSRGGEDGLPAQLRTTTGTQVTGGNLPAEVWRDLMERAPGATDPGRFP